MDQDNLDRVKKILLAANDILCDNLDVEDLLRKLKTKKVLKPGEIQTIRKNVTDEEKVEKMLDILRRKPVSAYEAFMELLKIERKDLYLKVKKIEEEYNYNSGSTSTEQTTTHKSSGEEQAKFDGMKGISEKDISDVTRKTKLTKSQLKTLFVQLDLEEHEIQKAEDNAGARDYNLQAASVLRHWMQINGQKATRQEIIDALGDCQLTAAKEALQKEWGLEEPLSRRPLKRTASTGNTSATEKVRKQNTTGNQPTCKMLVVALSVGTVVVAIAVISLYPNTTSTDVLPETKLGPQSKIPDVPRETKPGPQPKIPGTTLISNIDILAITRDLGLKRDQFHQLYNELGISSADVEDAEGITGAKTTALKAKGVLEQWRETNGEDATRDKILDALKRAKFNYALSKLKNIWGI